MIVLDILELLVQSLSPETQTVLGKVLEVLLHLMGSNQSVSVMNCIFATQRAVVCKFPDLVFYEETEQCAELCARLLRHCSSSVPEIRAWACASLYLLMRQNFDLLGNVSKSSVLYIYIYRERVSNFLSNTHDVEVASCSKNESCPWPSCARLELMGSTFQRHSLDTL